MNQSVGNLEIEFWHIGLATLGFLLSVFASGHAVLNKRDSRSAIAWVGFVWLVPLAGAVMYFILGVNRIRHKATLLRRNLERYRTQVTQLECLSEDVHCHLPGFTGHLDMLARAVGRVVERPLLLGNRIDPLVNGDEAYPAMLEAIQQSRQTISFVTYIFDRDEVGLAFAHALGDAVRRGVEVRVLIDAAGMRYSWPTILPALSHEGVKYARFLPSSALRQLMSINLRTHRKLLVADGRIGFTGGMNIRIGHCLKRQSTHPVQDIHFRVNGPVVTQLQEVFADDWLFMTGEYLRGDSWFPKIECAGQVLARGVVDGPDEDFEKLQWTILGGSFDRTVFSPDCNPVFSAKPYCGLFFEPGSHVGCASGYYFTLTEQPTFCVMGFTGYVVAGTQAWMPNLVDPASVRSLQTHACGRVLDATGIGQLGCEKFATQL